MIKKVFFSKGLKKHKHYDAGADSGNESLGYVSDVDLPHIKSSSDLPTCIDDFKEEHMKVLRRLNKHPVNENFSGIMSLEVDIPNFIPILCSEGLIQKTNYNESLELLKNDALKSILKKCNLKSSGTKKQLIERIQKEADPDYVKKIDEFTEFYIHTPKATKIIDESYNKFRSEKIEFRNQIIQLIQSKELQDAYRLICKRNAESPVPPGIGIDWEKCYYDGLDPEREKIYLDQLHNSSSNFSSALAIYFDMSGEKNSNANSYYEPESEQTDYSNYNWKIISTEINFESYGEAEIEEYQYLATLDNRTCPICGKLDGKIFPVKSKKIGVNCPPMHNGCRCTTVAVINRKFMKDETRSARDPVTGKTFKVPRSMDYQQWYDKFVRGNADAELKEKNHHFTNLEQS